MTWRMMRPKWLCKLHGHVSWEDSPFNLGGFQLCGCGKWFPIDDPHDPGSDSALSHPRFNMFGSSPFPPSQGQPPVSYEFLDRQAMPFVFLRDNPDELEKLNYLDLRRLIIERLADYEEGTDV